MVMVFNKNGHFLYAFSQSDEVKSDSINFHLNSVFIIDPLQKIYYGQKWQQKAIENFNLYVTSIFKNKSFMVDSYKIFGNYINKIINNIYKSGLILDIGAGYLSYSKMSDKNVISIDLNYYQSEKGGLFLNSRSSFLPFKINTFSLVLCNFLLEHVPNWEDVLKQAYLILKSEGKIIISIPSLNVSEFIKIFILRNQITLPIHHIRSFGIISYKFCESLIKFKKYLEIENFKILKIEAIDIIKPKNKIAVLFNKICGSVFPFKYLGSQTIIVAEKR